MESFQRVSSTGRGREFVALIPAVSHAVGRVENASVYTAFWGCAGGKWLFLPPELYRDTSYLIKGSPVRKLCGMKPRLQMYLLSFLKNDSNNKN